jgi:DNA primase catalytic core
MVKIDELAKEKLKASILVEDVAEHFGIIDRFGFKKIGSALTGNCLSGHDSTSGTCCKLHRKGNYFKCFQCGETFDAIEIVMTQKGVAYPEAVKYLAETWRRDLLEELIKEKWLAPEEKKKYSTSNLHEIIYEYGKELLFKPEGQEAYDYLTQARGYDPSKLLETEWMYWPKDEEIRTYLRKILPDDRKHEADEIKLNGIGGDNFRTALPYRQRFGHIVGFAKRHTSKEGLELLTDGKTQRYRWSFTAGLKKDDLFGLYNCKHSKQFKQSKQIIIVEGLPDASYLPAIGIDNILAVGQGCISEKHIEGLKIYEVQSAIIVFDNDKKTQTLDNITESANLLEENGIRAYIMPPEYMECCKDPDEFVVKYGIEKFKQIVKKSWASASWIPYHLSLKHDLSTDLGKDKALSEAATEYANLDREGDKTRFKQALLAFFKLAPDDLEDELALAEKKKKEEQEKERLKQVQKDAQDLIANGKIDQAKGLLDDFKKTENRQSLPQIKLAGDIIQEHDDYLSQYRGKEFIGLTQKTLPSLDKFTLGLRGLNLLAAAPNIGKTALTIQVADDILKANEDACVLFLSLEMPRNQIMTRIRCHLSKLDWNTFVLGSDGKPGEYNYFKKNDWEALQEGNRILRDVVGKRLWILGRQECSELTVHKVLSMVDALKAETGCSRILVVVDYLQVWPMPDEIALAKRTDIEHDKWRIGELKSLSEALGDDPVITISEARKPDRDGGWGDELTDVMGSARGVYTPDAVFLYRSAIQKNEITRLIKTKAQTINDELVEIISDHYSKQFCDIQRLTLRKGRDGMTKGDIFIKFHYRKNTFEEVGRDTLAREISDIMGKSVTVTDSPEKVKEKKSAYLPGQHRAKKEKDE